MVILTSNSLFFNALYTDPLQVIKICTSNRSGRGSSWGCYYLASFLHEITYFLRINLFCFTFYVHLSVTQLVDVKYEAHKLVLN